MTYTGKPRLLVLAVRTSIAQGEALTVTAFVLAGLSAQKVQLSYRRMGQDGPPWTIYPMAPVGTQGHGFATTLPPGSSDFEYYVTAKFGFEADEPTLYWPPGAPAATQTVVVEDGLH
jgi:hypothetical protein